MLRHISVFPAKADKGSSKILINIIIDMAEVFGYNQEKSSGSARAGGDWSRSHVTFRLR
jgi:hypothetical protein